MVRPILLSAACALIAPLANAETAQGEAPSREADTYRPSATYLVMRGSTPAACEAACLDDKRCRAWSLTPPTFRAGPKCELKSAAGDTVTKRAAVSGVVVVERSEPDAARPASKAGPVAPKPTETMTPEPAAQARPQAAPPPPPKIRPYTPPPLQQRPNADMPWPGLRRSGEDTRIIQPADKEPLPRRRSQDDVPAYSVQTMQTLPGDIEDAAGLYGRLPSGHTDEPEEKPED